MDSIHKSLYYTKVYRNILNLHPLDKNEAFIYGEQRDRYIDFNHFESSFKDEPS